MTTRHSAAPGSGRAGGALPLSAVVLLIAATLLGAATTVYTLALSWVHSVPGICVLILEHEQKAACAAARATHDMTPTYATGGLALCQVAVLVGLWALRRTPWVRWAAIPALAALAGAAHLVPPSE
ncbi:hypothetical protein [Streptomonospora wellingtoniae]|uniref:DUF2637 domain-containing protein n=1 Tax=Streptomonospora wellingtoniae TaxID=3075544 RepID=A0ABU2KU18_9ACTN|nr:hypothetical protein [Streptomonospora sp. DSM 45055]MDT0302748.1 hypothetical protein [Streptomonospora sp. DSM 45055]